MALDWVMWIIFFGIAVAGYFLCAAQLKIIRKEVWNWGDRLKCALFGAFFAAGISVIIGMGIIFGSGSPEFQQAGLESPQETLSSFMSIDLLIILIYLMVYPLVDFLFLAQSQKNEGLTPFQQFLERKAIDRFKTPGSYLIAILLYVGIVLAPPFVIFFIAGKNLVIIWLSWALVIPIALIAYYGAMGFVSGYYNVWSHLPNMGRALFEPGDRMMQDFKDGAAFRIVFGVMTFVYVWTWVSLFQTLGFMFGGGALVNTAGAAASVFMVLLFGIVGYFSRFWGRKVKFRTRDVLFAAYIIAAVGLNVMINFLVLNQNPLYGTFGGSDFTRPLVSGADSPWTGTNTPTNDYTWLVPAAIIEETMLVIVITYHFLHKNDPFMKNTKLSLITTSRQMFDPIPLFNFLRAKDPKVQKAAQEAVKEVYSRLPNRTDQDFTKSKFINPLMDGVCDPDPRVSEPALVALIEMEKTAGKRVVPIINKVLISPNLDKKYPVARTLLESSDEIVEGIPKNTILQLLNDPDWHVREVAAQIIAKRLETDPQFVTAPVLTKHLEDPDFGVQGEVMRALVKMEATIPASLVFSKLKHPNKDVRSSAALAFSNIDLSKVDSESLPFLVKMMDDPDWKVRAAVFEAIGKLKNFPKHALPVEPMLSGLVDQKEEVRLAASHALIQIAEKAPFHLDVAEIVQQYRAGGADTKIAMAPILGKLVQYKEEIILPVLFDSMSHPDPDLKRAAADQIVAFGKEKPQAVIDKLITVPEKAGFVKKGVVSQSFIKIGKVKPEVVVSFIQKRMNSPKQEERAIAATVIGDLGAIAPDLVDIQLLAKTLLEDKDSKVRKEMGKSISEIAEKSPQKIKNIVVNLIHALKDEDESVRISISKTIKNISANAPELIPIPPIIEKMADEDMFTRESLVNVLGNIGHKLPAESIKALIKSMSDPEWVVRNAAADALGKVAQHVPDNKEIPQLLAGLLDDPDKWVKSKAAVALSKIAEKNPDVIPVEKILKGMKEEDENVLAAYAQIAGAVGAKYFNLVVDPLVRLLGDDSQAVRDAAISAFTKISQNMKMDKMLPHLLKQLSDEVPITTQQSVALLFRRLVKYEREDVRKRVISLLSIRCEMSQDEVICGVLHELTSS